MKYQLITIPIALILSGSVSSNLAFAYSLADTVIGTDFYKFFEWQDIPDPLSGRVYVNQNKYLFFFLLILVETMSTKKPRKRPV